MSYLYPVVRALITEASSSDIMLSKKSLAFSLAFSILYINPSLSIPVFSKDSAHILQPYPLENIYIL